MKKRYYYLNGKIYTNLDPTEDEILTDLFKLEYYLGASAFSPSLNRNIVVVEISIDGTEIWFE